MKSRQRLKQPFDKVYSSVPRGEVGNAGGGINFLLVLARDRMYGNWKTCEIRDRALIRSQHSYQPFAVDDAETLLHDLLMHWRGVMDVHTVSLGDFKEDDFGPFLNGLVS